MKPRSWASLITLPLVLSVSTLTARVVDAWPWRAGLELQTGMVLAGSDIGIGSSALTDGAGSEWTGRLTLALSRPQAGGWQWRTGVAYQLWTIRDEVSFTFVPTSGPLQTVTLDLTQSVHELVVPLHTRFTSTDGRGWTLELGADVALRLAVRQRSESPESQTFSLLVPAGSREITPLAVGAEIFEDVGTFDGTNDITQRFVPVAIGASAGLGYQWAGTLPVHVGLTLQQGLHDQEDASIAVVRPTRVVLGLCVSL